MDTLQMETIDLVLVIVYLVGIAGVGLWAGRGMGSSKDLFLGGRTLPWWAVGASLVVSDIGAKDMMGLADDGYRYGLVMANFDLIGCVFPVLVAAFLFMPYLWLAGVYTIPEYLGRRYNSKVRLFFAIIWSGFMVGTVSLILVSAANMFESILQWSFLFSVVSTSVLVGAYTAFGGLRAVVFTDLVSCVVLSIGAALICIIGVHEAGGWVALQEKVQQIPQTEHHFDLIKPIDDPNHPWPAVLLGLGFVLGPAYWMGNQAIVQRTFGTSSQAEARASYVFCAAIKTVFPFLLVVPGLIGMALYHERLGDPDAETWTGGRVLPMVIQLLPPGVFGIVLGAFLAGIMSNLDSYLNSASTMCVTDIYVPWCNPRATDRHAMTVGRLLVGVFLVIGVVMSFYLRHWSSVFEAFQTFLSFFQGALLALLLCGMLSTRTTEWGGLVGFAVGVVTAAAMHYFAYNFLWVAWWSFVAALAATIAVSLFTEPHSEQRLRGLVYWLPGEPTEETS